MQLSVKFTSDRAYTVTTKNGLFVACYELLKTRAVSRLKSLYIGTETMQAATTIAGEIRRLFNVKVEIRAAQRCAAAFEVVIRSPKVALMEGIERFISTLIKSIKPQSAQVIPFPTAAAMPIAVGQANPAGRIRPKLAKDHLGRTTIAGITID